MEKKIKKKKKKSPLHLDKGDSERKRTYDHTNKPVASKNCQIIF